VRRRIDGAGAELHVGVEAGVVDPLLAPDELRPRQHVASSQRDFAGNEPRLRGPRSLDLHLAERRPRPGNQIEPDSNAPGNHFHGVAGGDRHVTPLDVEALDGGETGLEKREVEGAARGQRDRAAHVLLLGGGNAGEVERGDGGVHSFFHVEPHLDGPLGLVDHFDAVDPRVQVAVAAVEVAKHDAIESKEVVSEGRGAPGAEEGPGPRAEDRLEHAVLVGGVP
jgi:hypothetical protein